MRSTILLVALLLVLQGCGSTWRTIPSSHLYLAEADGPVALYLPSGSDAEFEGLQCVDLTTMTLRWAASDVHSNLLAFSRDRRHFHFVEHGDRQVRFFRTADGRELGALSEATLGGPDLHHFDTQVAISSDGRFVGAAGRHGGKGGALLRLIALSSGERRDLTFEESWAVRDLRFGPSGWLAVRSLEQRRTVYAYDDGGLREALDLSARQAWWASERLVLITPDGRFETIAMDGSRHETPGVSLGPEVAQMLDDRPERVHVSADGEHLLYDGSDYVLLLRLSDGAEIFRAPSHGHRGSRYEGVQASYFSDQTAGVAYTANDDFEGRLAIIDLRDGTSQIRSLGRLGSYGGGLPGFDLGPSFRWQQRPELTLGGEFLVLVHDDEASVQAVRSDEI